MTLPAGVIVGARRSSGVSHWGVLGGGRDATKHLTMHRVAPTTDHYLVPYVNSAVLEVLKKYCVLVFKSST